MPYTQNSVIYSDFKWLQVTISKGPGMQQASLRIVRHCAVHML